MKTKQTTVDQTGAHKPARDAGATKTHKRKKLSAAHLAAGVVAVGLLLCAACSSNNNAGNTGTTGTSGKATGTTGTTAGPGSPGYSQPTDPFYQAASPLPYAKPGTVINTQPLAGAPNGATGTKILYHSTDINGQDIAVSGVIITPAGTPPQGGWPIYSWAHPTTGVVDSCAPSVSPDFYTSIPGLTTILQNGFIVAATDYQGLGTPGIHPYLVGQSEGQNVLDAARAAINLNNTNGVVASNNLYINGHSQGGQGSLFAGQEQPTYAPELTLKAVAAMAPAALLGPLMEAQANSLYGVILGGYALNAYNDVYSPTTPGMNLDNPQQPQMILTPQMAQTLPQIVGLCVSTQTAQLAQISAPLVGNAIQNNPANVQPWQNLLQQNTAGANATPAPMFIAQGEQDNLVLPATTQAFVAGICGAPNNDVVQFNQYADATHFTIPQAAIGDITTWMQNIQAGQTAPNNCAATLATPIPVLTTTTVTTTTAATTGTTAD